MLRTRLLGGLELRWEDGSRIELSSRAGRELLAFLALEPGRRWRREVVAGRLWGDRSDRSARKALRSGLWRLRASLAEHAPADALRADAHHVFLGQGVWVDVQAFRHRLRALPADDAEPLGREAAAELEEAAALYRGDLLEGIYEPWVTPVREELRLAYLEVLEALFRHRRRTGMLRSALGLGRTILRHDPFVERVHRELMLCHWLMGDRPLAVRQYRACEAVLRDELGLAPMPETRALLDRILLGAAPPPRATPLGWGPPPYPSPRKVGWGEGP